MFFCFRYVFIESYLIMFCVYFTCRVYKENFLLSCKEIGRLPPTFADASAVAQEILDSGFEYDNEDGPFEMQLKNTVACG